MAGRGSEQHEEIKGIVRFSVANRIKESGCPDLCVCCDESFMALLTGQLEERMKGESREYPDVFFLNDRVGVCVEVGDYNPSKWFEFPVVHIGFNGLITPIRCENVSFAMAVYDSVIIEFESFDYFI